MGDTTRQFGESNERRLAAIMFTDVVGSSRLMGENEERAVRLINRDLSMIEAQVEEHGGRPLKKLGDGVLAVFDSAVRAVDCAQEIQRQFSVHQAELPPAEVLQHRIGIHLGDIYEANGDVMGDGVNIAARLQTEAPPGGICLSQVVYELVKARLSLKTVYEGMHHLKNIAEDMHIYRLVVQGGSSGAAEPEPMAPVSAEQRESSWARYMPLVLLAVIAVLAVTRWNAIHEEAGESDAPPAAARTAPAPVVDGPAPKPRPPEAPPISEPALSTASQAHPEGVEEAAEVTEATEAAEVTEAADGADKAEVSDEAELSDEAEVSDEAEAAVAAVSLGGDRPAGPEAAPTAPEIAPADSDNPFAWAPTQKAPEQEAAPPPSMSAPESQTSALPEAPEEAVAESPRDQWAEELAAEMAAAEGSEPLPEDVPTGPEDSVEPFSASEEPRPAGRSAGLVRSDAVLPRPVHQFAELDANGDDRLAPDELESLAPEARHRLLNADADGDGTLAFDELTRRLRAALKPQSPGWVRTMLRFFDADQDGQLARDELPLRNRERLMRGDRDADGRLSEAELSALQRSFRGRGRSGRDYGAPESEYEPFGGDGNSHQQRRPRLMR